MSNEIAVRDTADYAIVKRGENITDVVKTNLGASMLSLKDLTRITIPAGGALNWEIPTFKGPQSVPSIEGIIVNVQETRSFWRGAYTGEGSRPDCFSPDGVSGIGDPGVTCQSCEFSQWKSATDGKGQACKLKYTVFMVRENDLLPIAITLPPTSVAPVRTYLAQLTQEGLPYYAVVTALKLDQEKSSGGIKYSRVAPVFVSEIDTEQVGVAEKYAIELRDLLSRRPAETDDE